MKRNRIACFLGLILLISIAGIGCSKKEAETESESKSLVDGLINEDNLMVPEGEETEIPAGEENDSPWVLLSETSVDTAVNYAGFLNESLGVTVGYAGAVSYTADGGKNWSKSSIVSACRYGLDFYDESFLITSGNSGVNMISEDKGENWSYLGEFPLKSSGVYNKFLSVTDRENIYIGAQKALGVTNDGGKTWKEIELPEKCNNMAGMFFLTSETGYLLNIDGTLFKTADSCKTWTEQAIDLAGEKILQNTMPMAAINFQDEKNGMIIYGTKSYQVFCLKTEDGGSTWESVKMPKTFGQSPYLSRDGRFLTISTPLKKISLYQLTDK